MLLGVGEMPNLSLPSSRRHRLRVTVRVMMALVLILGCGLGMIVHRARVQREAVAAIRRAGGSVMYEHELRPRIRGTPWWPKWVAEFLGTDYLDDV